MKVDLGRFEDFGYADVIQTGHTKEQLIRMLEENARKLGVEIKIKVVGKHPKINGRPPVIWDAKTGRCSMDLGD